MVYQIQKRMTSYIKDWHDVNRIEYFSDGCVGQYKSKSNFFNLCKHEEEFGLKSNWTFFATSHGKSPCDGIGGTIKRVTAKSSLQWTVNDQILNCAKMFDFCINGNHFPNIVFLFISTEEMKELRCIFLFISTEEMKELRCILKQRFEGLKPIPGTRSYHQFNPINDFTVGTKRSSKQTNVHSFTNQIPKSIYKSKWYKTIHVCGLCIRSTVVDWSCWYSESWCMYKISKLFSCTCMVLHVR